MSNDMSTDRFLTNPINLEYLRRLMDTGGPRTQNYARDSLYSIPIHVSDFVPERSWRDQWFPPDGDRFCCYGPEDEVWMRPLGLGTVKRIDMGPAIFAMQTRLDRFVYDNVFNAPPAIFRPMA